MVIKDQKDESKELADFINKLETKRFDKTILNDDWLKKRSYTQLMKIVKALGRRLEGETTLKVKKADLPAAQDEPITGPPELKSPGEVIIVPASPTPEKLDYVWEMTLVPKTLSTQPLRLKIWDDFSIGIQRGSKKVDLNLAPLGAAQMGVSRRHAVIRMSADGLYLVDLGSTNGTYYRGNQLKVGEPVKLAERGAIAFGSLVLSIAKINKL